MTDQELFDELKKQLAFQRGAQALVIEKARQYATMKAFGTYEERGSVISVGFNDRERYAKMFADNLLHEAERMIAEEMRTGALISQVAKGTK